MLALQLQSVCLGWRIPRAQGRRSPVRTGLMYHQNVGHCWRGEAVTRDRRLRRKLIRSLCVQADLWVKTPDSPQGMSLDTVKFWEQRSQVPLMFAVRTAIKIPFQLRQSSRGAPTATHSLLQFPPELFFAVSTDSHACSSICGLEGDRWVPGHSRIA